MAVRNNDPSLIVMRYHTIGNTGANSVVLDPFGLRSVPTTKGTNHHIPNIRLVIHGSKSIGRLPEGPTRYLKARKCEPSQDAYSLGRDSRLVR